MNHDQPDRRAALLTAAIGVFARYGFRKTSMDEVARAAGLSRQGLYGHFATKDALFREAVHFLLESSLGAGARALAAPGDGDGGPLEEALLDAFDAAYGPFLGSDGLSGSPHLGELLEAAQALLGDLIATAERDFKAAVARRLEAVAAAWAPLGLGAAELTEVLDAAAAGLKHRRTNDRAAFRERLSQVIRLVCRGRADDEAHAPSLER